MASLVARVAAAAAALSSGQARRLGSGRLPLAALPGHGAGVLAGRRGGTAHGGVLAILFKAPARDVRVACSQTGNDADGGRMEDVDDFNKMYNIRSLEIERMLLSSGGGIKTIFTRREREVQDNLKNITDTCIDLLYDAIRRLPRAERKRLDVDFWETYMDFAKVRARASECRAKLKMAVAVAERLEVIRRMVSDVCCVPLSLDMKKTHKHSELFSVQVSPLEFPEVVVFAMLNSLYETVKKDIEDIFSRCQSLEC